MRLGKSMGHVVRWQQQQVPRLQRLPLSIYSLQCEEQPSLWIVNVFRLP